MNAVVDFIVVGAGPAGSIIAGLLASHGAEVILLDQSNSHWNAVELLTAKGRRGYSELFKNINFENVGQNIYETVSLWDTPVPMSSSALFNPYGHSVAINRDEFNQYCQKFSEHSGAHIIKQTFCESCELQNSIWNVKVVQSNKTLLLKARFCIQATGYKKPQLLNPNRNLTASNQFILLTRVKNFNNVYANSFFVERCDSDWWYAIPELDDQAFVGFYTSDKKVKKPTELFFIHQLRKTHLIKTLFSNPIINNRVRGKISGPRIYNMVCGAQWASVGDSAFITDPLSGQGLEFALQSAQQLFSSLFQDHTIPYQEWVNAYANQHIKMRVLVHSDFMLSRNGV
ncbi:MAG: FAD-dependent monooxygenase [Pseudomonadota bacterium]